MEPKAYIGGGWKRYAVAVALLAAALIAGLVLFTGRTGDQGAKAPDSQVTPDTVSGMPYPITVIDDASREVVIAARPEKVVSLAPANTEIVAAVAGLDRLVGVTTFCDYPAEVSGIAKVGDFVQPNVEAIVAADPDVVFATGGVQGDVIGKLEEAGAVVVVVDPQTLDQLYSAIARVASVMGAPQEADRVIGEMRATLQEVGSAISGKQSPRVFIEIAQDPLFTAASGTLIDQLISAAGGVNVAGAQSGYVGYSLEQLVKDDPDVYLATKGSMSDPSQLGKRAGYSSLSAVKNDRVAVLDDNLVSRPGPRVVEGVKAIAAALYPGVFGQ